MTRDFRYLGKSRCLDDLSFQNAVCLGTVQIINEFPSLGLPLKSIRNLYSIHRSSSVPRINYQFKYREDDLRVDILFLRYPYTYNPSGDLWVTYRLIHYLFITNLLKKHIHGTDLSKNCLWTSDTTVSSINIILWRSFWFRVCPIQDRSGVLFRS